jgi:hypothetical protein
MSAFARTLFTLATTAIALPALAGSVSAQIPSISAPKAAAARAVAATNAHTAAMQDPEAGASGGARSAADPPVGVTAAAPTLMRHTTIGAASVGTVDSDSDGRSISVTDRGPKGEMSLSREVYTYEREGRRDPFVSLLKNGELRPMLSDLRLSVVLFDPARRNSIAILHDISSPTKAEYRVRVGEPIGRMRVDEIDPQQVVFTIEEIGYNRQAVLALGDSTQARTQ